MELELELEGRKIRKKLRKNKYIGSGCERDRRPTWDIPRVIKKVRQRGNYVSPFFWYVLLITTTPLSLFIYFKGLFHFTHIFIARLI